MASAKCQTSISKLSPGTASSAGPPCCCVLTELPSVTFTWPVWPKATNLTETSVHEVRRCKTAKDGDRRTIWKSGLASNTRVGSHSDSFESQLHISELSSAKFARVSPWRHQICLAAHQWLRIWWEQICHVPVSFHLSILTRERWQMEDTHAEFQTKHLGLILKSQWGGREPTPWLWSLFMLSCLKWRIKTYYGREITHFIH